MTQLRNLKLGTNRLTRNVAIILVIFWVARRFVIFDCEVPGIYTIPYHDHCVDTLFLHNDHTYDRVIYSYPVNKCLYRGHGTWKKHNDGFILNKLILFNYLSNEFGYKSKDNKISHGGEMIAETDIKRHFFSLRISINDDLCIYHVKQH